MGDKTDIFQIERNIIYNGEHYKKSINAGDQVLCYFCNWRFAIGKKTVSLSPADDMPIINCPKCRSHVPVLYYFDRVINKDRKFPKHKRNHKKTNIYHHREKEIAE